MKLLRAAIGILLVPLAMMTGFRFNETAAISMGFADTPEGGRLSSDADFWGFLGVISVLFAIVVFIVMATYPKDT